MGKITASPRRSNLLRALPLGQRSGGSALFNLLFVLLGWLSGGKLRFRSSISMPAMAKARSMPSFRKPRGSISAALQSRRSVILRDGRRRFYVFPVDLTSSLYRVPHSSLSECLASAHTFLRSLRASPSMAFEIVERAELHRESVWVGVQEVLVFDETMPIRREAGADSRNGASRGGSPVRGTSFAGASGATAERAAFKA